jgi:hypothetical protein
MMRGGVRLSTFPSHISRHPGLQATWQLDPAAMHGGVQFICPAMYDSGAKQTSFKNIFKYGPDPKIYFKFGLKIKKWQTMTSARSLVSFRMTSWNMAGWPSGAPALFHGSCDVWSGGIPGANWNVSCRFGQLALVRESPIRTQAIRQGNSQL